RDWCAAKPRPSRPPGLHRISCPPGCTGHASACPERHGGGLAITRPKTWRRNPGPRVMAMPAGLVDMLRAHRAEQAAERLAAGSTWQDHDLVSCRPDGRPIGPDQDRLA